MTFPYLTHYHYLCKGGMRLHNLSSGERFFIIFGYFFDKLGNLVFFSFQKLICCLVVGQPGQLIHSFTFPGLFYKSLLHNI